MNYSRGGGSIVAIGGRGDIFFIHDAEHYLGVTRLCTNSYETPSLNIM